MTEIRPSDYLIKLVRDHVEGTLRHDKHTVVYGPVDAWEFEKLLKRKLIEEAAEFVADPSVDELADVLQVVKDLAEEVLGIDLQELEVAAGNKYAERGGFTGTGMYAREVGDD